MFRNYIYLCYFIYHHISHFSFCKKNQKDIRPVVIIFDTTFKMGRYYQFHQKLCDLSFTEICPVIINTIFHKKAPPSYINVFYKVFSPLFKSRLYYLINQTVILRFNCRHPVISITVFSTFLVD